ncbi:MAG TPA: DNA methyltransferase [Verrucomicrobiae bacterium]|nr:DNA methyltransferase [Verrucomicrobiae bacterium]
MHLVADILNELDHSEGVVLDPFCGTGTTALVCAERGIQADTIDINPFLIWLAQTKCADYTSENLEHFSDASSSVLAGVMANGSDEWIPAIHEIEKWWDAETLHLLGRLMAGIHAANCEPAVTNLLKIVFCRVMIEAANVSFGHQSMSFKAPAETCLFHDKKSDFVTSWQRASKDVLGAAGSPVKTEVHVSLVDARRLDENLTHDHYDCIITSPPYPNRMSYIRELRPYMYWFGFLTSGRQAGELDWEAIGGTWGCATSNLQKWSPNGSGPIPFEDFEKIILGIHSHSKVLATYVNKYFYDMMQHVRGVYKVMKSGGQVNYIVGNSKFYDVLLPVEQIFAAMFREAGFNEVAVRTLRKRTSKKELYEYLVSGTK